MRKPLILPHVFVVLALLLNLPAMAQPVAEPRTKLTVATYNIENLFDVFDDPYTADEGTKVKPREQLEKVAAMIRKLDADVIAFQEIENENVLKAFITEMLGDMNYKYVAAATTNDGRGIRTAIASRLPIQSIVSYRFLDLTLEGDERIWRFSRDLMHVKLEVSKSRVLHTFIVHLKSKRDAPDDKQGASWRLAEATMSRKIIDSILAKDPTAWVIMTGDLNDIPDSPPIKQFTSDLPAAATRPASKGLTDLHEHLTGEDAISYLKKPYRSRIDYILASPELGKRVVKESAKVVNSEIEMTTGSDHAPVIATFDVKE